MLLVNQAYDGFFSKFFQYIVITLSHKLDQLKEQIRQTCLHLFFLIHTYTYENNLTKSGWGGFKKKLFPICGERCHNS